MNLTKIFLSFCQGPFCAVGVKNMFYGGLCSVWDFLHRLLFIGSNC
jgi:hypothetical protein